MSLSKPTVFYGEPEAKTATLSWDVPAGADLFEFEIRKPGGEWEFVFVSPVQNFTGDGLLKGLVVGLKPETEYLFRVRAINPFLQETSDWAACVVVTLKATLGLTANAGLNRVSLNWNDIDALYYTVQYREGSAAWTAAYTGNGLSTTISGLKANTTYKVKCKAVLDHSGSGGGEGEEEPDDGEGEEEPGEPEEPGDDEVTETITVTTNKKAKFTYYEVESPDSYTTKVEGQAKIVLKIVTPKWENNDSKAGEPVSYEIKEEASDKPKPPDPPKFEAVYLKLKNHAIPEYAKTQGICNDCTVPRVRGVFIREDANGKRFPMLFEVPTLRVGGAIRSRQADCFYKTENDSCSPKGNQPEMKLIRSDAWRLILDPNTCSITCTELNDKTKTPDPDV